MDALKSSRVPEWVTSPHTGKAGELLVLDPEWSPVQLREELSKLAAGPQRVLFTGFVNLSGADALITQLQGGRVRGWSEQEVNEAAAAAGLKVRARKGQRAPNFGLAADTATALRGLFAQLNENTADDWVVLELERDPSAAEVPPPFTPGLLSVVIRNHSVSRLQALDEAIFSLATQNYRALEILVVTQSVEKGAVKALEEVLERHQRVGGYAARVLHVPSKVDIRARLVNVGLEAARGQYIAVLDDDDVVYPHHYSRMIDAIRATEHAWAVSPIRRSYNTRDGHGQLYCISRNLMPMAGEFDWAKLVHDNYITCHAWVVDRARIGKHQVRFEEQLTKSEDYVMLLRLAALFRPAVITGGPSAEYRIRDDGTNTIVHEALAEKTRLRMRREWDAAMALKDRVTFDLQLLTTRGEMLGVFAKIPEFTPPVQQWKPDELRYRIADRANTLLKEKVPGVHKQIKTALARISPTK